MATIEAEKTAATLCLHAEREIAAGSDIGEAQKWHI